MSLTFPSMRKIQQLGFSLVEMAIVLVIVGVLLGGLLPTISSQIEQQRRNETRKQMDEIKDGLFGFAISNGYLPCPAVSASSGVEDRDSVTKACTGNKRVGFIPWVTLGVSKTDGWGRIFRYSATPTFTTASGVFSVSTPRDITIQKLDGSNLSNASDVPAVIVSHGANGIFGTLDNGNTVPSNAPNSFSNVAHQIANVSGVWGAGAPGTTFFSGDPTARTASNDEDFDDLVVWLSPYTLFNRMVMASKLPLP